MLITYMAEFVAQNTNRLDFCQPKYEKFLK
jgi:hypothetical protein